MQKVSLALVVGLWCVAALPVQAATIGQQTDSSQTVGFVSQNTSSNGFQGNVFTLPALTGTLKAFDLYLSQSGYNTLLGTYSSPTTVQLILGGAGCPASGQTYTSAQVGIPTNDAAVTDNPDDPYFNNIHPPASVHLTLDSGSWVAYTGQSGCTVEFRNDGFSNKTLMSTKIATGTVDQLYFVGYDTIGTAPTIHPVSMSTNNASSTSRGRVGDTVTITFTGTTPDALQTPTVTIGAHSAAVATTSTSGTSTTYSASTTLDGTDADGVLAFAISLSNTYGDNTSAAATTDSSSVVVDNTAPTLGEVAAIGTTTNATPSYSFSSSEAGTITYGGSCASAATAASAGTTTLTFNTLAPGTYSDCELTVADAAGNAATLPVTSFVVAPAPAPAAPTYLGDNGPIAGSLPAPVNAAPQGGAGGGGAAVIPTVPQPTSTPAPLPAAATGPSSAPEPLATEPQPAAIHEQTPPAAPASVSEPHPAVGSAVHPSAPSAPAAAGQGAAAATAQVGGSSSLIYLLLGGLLGGLAAAALLFITSI